MAEYIEREKIITDIKNRYCNPCENEGKDYNHVKCKACWVMDMIDEIEEAKAEEVKEEEYCTNLRSEYLSLFECSSCGWCDDDTYTSDTDEYNYCPNCGKRVKKGETANVE